VPHGARGRGRGDTGSVSTPTEDDAIAPEPDTVSYGGVEFNRAPTRRHGRQTVRDMVLSMAVVGLGVLFLLVVAWRPNKPDAEVRVVDWTTTAVAASAAAEYPLVVPTGLSSQWRSTSARFERLPQSSGRPAWQVGFVTPGEQYAGLIQSDGDPAALVAGTVQGGRPEGEVQVGGVAWQAYSAGENGYRTLVRTLPRSTVIVTGSAEQAELVQLAASLVEQP